MNPIYTQHPILVAAAIAVGGTAIVAVALFFLADIINDHWGDRQ